MRRLVTLLAILGITGFPVQVFAQSAAIDFSYDKCSGSKAASYVGHYNMGIVGVNAGGDWEKNPCLKDEITHFDHYFLYVNTNYPSDQCQQALSRPAAYHCGYNLGRWDVDYAASQGAHANLWFLDVEEGPGIPWSGNDNLNSVFLYGLGKGIQSKTTTGLGFYSTGLQWGDITGGWNGRNVDWYATGSIGKPSQATIKQACSTNFSQGQGVVFYQYIVGDFDHNDYC